MKIEKPNRKLRKGDGTRTRLNVFKGGYADTIRQITCNTKVTVLVNIHSQKKPTDFLFEAYSLSKITFFSFFLD